MEERDEGPSDGLAGFIVRQFGWLRKDKESDGERNNGEEDGLVAGGGFREYGLKVRPSNRPKVFTSNPVNGESRSARPRGRTKGRR